MCVIWGIPYLLIRVAVREVTPAVLVFGRTAIARAPAAADRRPSWRAARSGAALAADRRLRGDRAGTPLAAARERRADAVELAVGTAGRGRAADRGADRDLHGDDERLGGRRLGGLLVGLAGVAAIAGVSIRTASVVALLEVGVVATSYAVGPIVLSRSLADLPSLGVIAVSLTLCALVYGARRSPAPRRGAVGPRARVDRDARASSARRLRSSSSSPSSARRARCAPR